MIEHPKTWCSSYRAFYFDTRTYSPAIWKLLDDWVIGRLPLYMERDVNLLISIETMIWSGSFLMKRMKSF